MFLKLRSGISIPIYSKYILFIDFQGYQRGDPTTGLKMGQLSLKNYWFKIKDFVTLFKPIVVFFGTDNILRDIPYIRVEYEEYSIKYCQPYYESK